MNKFNSSIWQNKLRALINPKFKHVSPRSVIFLIEDTQFGGEFKVRAECVIDLKDKKIFESNIGKFLKLQYKT
jgi:hypothetical protein